MFLGKITSPPLVCKGCKPSEIVLTVVNKVQILINTTLQVVGTCIYELEAYSSYLPVIIITARTANMTIENICTMEFILQK